MDDATQEMTSRGIKGKKKSALAIKTLGKEKEWDWIPNFSSFFPFLKKDKREVGNFKDKFEKKVLSSRFTQKRKSWKFCDEWTF